MDFHLNVNLDLELKPLKSLKNNIKSFKKQQMDDLFNLVKDQKKKEEGPNPQNDEIVLVRP